MIKPLLVGMNNPLSDDPRHALYPAPVGSTGHRIWRMLPEGTLRKHYLEAFDRVNLLPGREWNLVEARKVGPDLWSSLRDRRGVVVVLGTGVREALGLPRVEACVMHQRLERNFPNEAYWCAIPHPSGLNRWYNYPANVNRVRALLAQLMRGYP